MKVTFFIRNYEVFLYLEIIDNFKSLKLKISTYIYKLIYGYQK